VSAVNPAAFHPPTRHPQAAYHRDAASPGDSGKMAWRGNESLCASGSGSSTTLTRAGIVRNHPFVDGNKRTGFMLGAGFLERNGWEFMADEADAVIQTLALAANAITQEPYASWLGSNSRRRKG
jgi:hypothetical protein